jgi:hypothetical protein
MLLGNLPIPNLLDRMMEVLAQVQPGDALRLVQPTFRTASCLFVNIQR